MIRKRNILITGSSGGIGTAIVDKLTLKDYTNTIGLHYNKSKSYVNYYHFVPMIALRADFNKPRIDIVKKFIKNYGWIDVLINCAGVFSDVPFDKLTVEEYDGVMNINSRATFMVTRDAFNYMKKNKTGGKIINISSVATKFGMGRNNSIHYAASKATLDTLTIGLAKMGAPYNILVNSISVGVINTKSQKDRKERKELIPLKRFGKPEDVANMVEYLVSEKGNFITGQIIGVTGGE